MLYRMVNKEPLIAIRTYSRYDSSAHISTPTDIRRGKEVPVLKGKIVHGDTGKTIKTEYFVVVNGFFPISPEELIKNNYVVPLGELLEVAGSETGIRYSNGVFFRGITPMRRSFAIERLLDVYIPEKIKLPEDISKISESKLDVVEGGLVFDSLDEVLDVVEGVFRGSIKTENTGKLVESLEEHAIKYMRKDPNSFFESMFSELRTSLLEKGYFEERFEGTILQFNFAEGIKVEKVGDKYVLGFRGELLSGRVDREIAEKLNVERAYTFLGAEFGLQEVGDYFVALDVERMLKDTGIKNSLIRGISKRLAKENDFRGFPFSFEGENYSLEFRIADPYKNSITNDPFRVKNTVYFTPTFWEKNAAYLRLRPDSKKDRHSLPYFIGDEKIAAKEAIRTLYDKIVENLS